MKGEVRLEEIKGREIERQGKLALTKKQACVLTEFAAMEMLSRSYSKCRMDVRMHSRNTSASRHPRLAPSGPPIVPKICCSQLWSPTAAPCLKKKENHVSASTSMKQCGLKRTPLFSSAGEHEGNIKKRFMVEASHKHAEPLKSVSEYKGSSMNVSHWQKL